MLNESGSPVPFYIAKHDYESDLNGAGRTLLVRKDCYDMHAFSNRNNAYANSALDTWHCNTWLKLLDTDIQTMIGTTKFYYTVGGGDYTVATLQRAVFQLSITELGNIPYYANTEGSTLPIASMLQIAYYNGAATAQWTRSAYPYNDNDVICVNSLNRVNYTGYYGQFGSRPAFTLPGTLALAQNTDGTYSIAA